MGIPNISQIGVSGMQTSRAAVATTGHNIANANTEGYSRQRVEITENLPENHGNHATFGRGALIARVSRTNDEYLEKQIRNANRDMSQLEEKDMVLHQTEDVFNEMNGDGLNRVVAKFFNEFRKLSNEPESEALRQSVREATNSAINEFHRLRNDVEDIKQHIDARIEGHCREINATAKELADINLQIMNAEGAGNSGAPANDLHDKRDVIVKKLASYLDIATHVNERGSVTADIRGVGPLVVDTRAEELSTTASAADDRGKPEASFDITTTGNAGSKITHAIKGGKLGALLEVRDGLLSTVLDRLDEMAYNISKAVNEVHVNGFTRNGQQGVAFFKDLDVKERAAEKLALSDAVRADVGNIATAAQADAPGDNRIALAISGLQGQKLMGNGAATADDFYNAIVSDVGVASAQNKSSINQQRDQMQQLNKMREQLSGVSIDEETANLMQFQHTYDASAKVIQVADDMLKTVLELKR